MTEDPLAKRPEDIPYGGGSQQPAPPQQPYGMPQSGYGQPPPGYGGALPDHPFASMPPEQRKAILAQVVAQRAALGERVESQMDFQAVLVAGKPVNHVLHLILTLVTCFAWGIVWIILAFTAGEKRQVIAVDEYGYIQRR